MIYTPEEKTGEIVDAITVKATDDVVVITSLGKTLKIAADTVADQGKSARGVRVLNIDKPDFVIGLDKVMREDDATDLAEASVQAEAIEKDIALLDDPVPEGLGSDDTSESVEIVALSLPRTELDS
jgi:DNA gyrase subunit A